MVLYYQDAADLIKSRYMSVATSVYFSLMALSGVPQDD